LSDLIIKNNGVEFNNFYIPPFELRKGEIVGIDIHNDEYSFDIEMYLRNIFSGEILNKNVVVNKRLTFVKYAEESRFKWVYYPFTVEQYLKKYSDLNNYYSKKIYDVTWITKKTKINKLPGNPRKWLSLYCTLSKEKNIMLDVAGQDHEGIKTTIEIVKKETECGGSAIFFDHFKAFKNDSTNYVRIEAVK